MAKSLLNRFTAIVIAFQLVLGACSYRPVQSYEGPERPPEETALVTIADGDCAGRILAVLNSVDRGDITFPAKTASVLPGAHTFRASWKRRKCDTGPSHDPLFNDPLFLPILLPIALIAAPIVLLGREEPPDYDYGEGTRDFVATLDAGKEYKFRVYGKDGKQVFLWIQEKETGAVVGGESPDEKTTVTRASKSSEETAALSASPIIASWNGKWFAKDGAWSLYLDVENGTFTGRVLRRGSDPFPVTGTISPDFMVSGRVDDERGASAGSLSGMFPNLSVYQDGRVQASFDLEKRE